MTSHLSIVIIIKNRNNILDVALSLIAIADSSNNHFFTVLSEIQPPTCIGCMNIKLGKKEHIENEQTFERVG